MREKDNPKSKYRRRYIYVSECGNRDRRITLTHVNILKIRKKICMRITKV